MPGKCLCGTGDVCVCVCVCVCVHMGHIDIVGEGRKFKFLVFAVYKSYQSITVFMFIPNGFSGSS